MSDPTGAPREPENYGIYEHAREYIIERPQGISEALEAAASCVDFAYEHGYHEHGIPIPDILLVIAREYDIIPKAELARLTSERDAMRAAFVEIRNIHRPHRLQAEFESCPLCNVLSIWVAP